MNPYPVQSVSVSFIVTSNDNRTIPYPLERLSESLQLKIANLRKQVFNEIANSGKSSGSVSIMDFSEELLLEIFLRVIFQKGGMQSVYSLMRVSKVWRQVAQDSKIWKIIARVKLIDVKPGEEFFYVANYLRQQRVNYQYAIEILSKKDSSDEERSEAKECLLFNAKNLHEKSIKAYLATTDKCEPDWVETNQTLDSVKLPFATPQKFYAAYKDTRSTYCNISKVKEHHYLKQTALRNHAEAQLLLAHTYRDGIGVKQSPQKYERYLKLSADHPEAFQAKLELAEWYLNNEDKEHHSLAFVFLKHENESSDNLYLLGRCYAEGKGVEKSMNDALSLWNKAASFGHSKSQVALAKTYEEGTGVPQSQEKALEYWKRAANQENPDAMCAVAKAYFSGKLVILPQHKNAIMLLESAAAKGHAESLYWLGRAFYFGFVVKQDYDLAQMRLKQAAALGFPAALYLLGCASSEGNGVIQSNEYAIEFWRKAAAKNDTLAQYQLGLCYRDGTHGVKKSDKEAFFFFSSAAEANHPDALCALGIAYHRGNGVSRSEEKAVSCFLLSAQQGNAEAFYLLGYAYSRGMGGLQKSIACAIDYWKRASDLGVAWALLELARLYESGEGVVKSKEIAFSYYKRAADQAQNPEGQYKTGMALMEGFGTEKSLGLAFSYLQRAADQGHRQAREILPAVSERAKLALVEATKKRKRE
jgi:TPR repeat protein